MKWDEIRGLLIYLKKNENVYFFINIELLYNIFKSKTKFILFILFFSLFKLSRFSFIILYTFFSINYKKTCFLNEIKWCSNIFFNYKIGHIEFFSFPLTPLLFIHTLEILTSNKQTNKKKVEHFLFHLTKIYLFHSY